MNRAVRSGGLEDFSSTAGRHRPIFPFDFAISTIPSCPRDVSAATGATDRARALLAIEAVIGQ